VFGRQEREQVRSVLAEVLAVLAEERERQFERSFGVVDRLLAEYGEIDLAERLYREIPVEAPWQLVADLFSILLWQTSDNGAALSRTTEEWLVAGNDRRQIHIALHLDSYPFLDREKMEAVLGQIADRHPEAAERCRELIASRRLVGEPGGRTTGCS
jgi:hypothetical protein